jgi:hypothetical protein
MLIILLYLTENPCVPELRRGLPDVSCTYFLFYISALLLNGSISELTEILDAILDRPFPFRAADPCMHVDLFK